METSIHHMGDSINKYMELTTKQIETVNNKVGAIESKQIRHEDLTKRVNGHSVRIKKLEEKGSTFWGKVAWVVLGVLAAVLIPFLLAQMGLSI